MGIGAPTDPGRQTILTKELAPWTPDVDARRSDKPIIIAGRNFLDAMDGQYSAFSSAFVNWNPFNINTRLKISELRVDNDILYGTPTGVYKIDQTTGLINCLIPVTVTNTYWPWTIAKVGGLFYIAQYGIGLWQYNEATNAVTYINTPSGENIFYVWKSQGRLCYIDQTVVAVSALDDGTNFIPNLATAAQAQAQSMVGGTAYAGAEIDDGFLVFFTEGVLKATYTQAAYVFQFAPLAKTVKLFSPNAQCFVPEIDSIITVDAGGFYQTTQYKYQTEGLPQPWEPAMSDYVRKNIIAGMNKNLLGAIGMYYSQALKCLFIYFSSNFSQGLFQTTLVWNAVNSKWGSFDESHYGIFETYNPTNGTYTCSYMDINGYMKEFSNTNYSEDYPDDGTLISDYLWRPLLSDAEMVLYNGLPSDPANTPIYYANSEFKISTNDPWAFTNYNTSGLYQINSQPNNNVSLQLPDDPPGDTIDNPMIFGSYINFFESGNIVLNALPYLINEIGLNSFVTIGPIRFNDQQSWAEETSAIESILVGMNATDNFILYSDWNIVNGTADWNSFNGAQDWGSGTTTSNTYEATLRDSMDGFSQPFQGDEDLNTFIDNGSSQLFKPSGVSSIYHSVTISAEDVGDYYNVKIIDITAQQTGVQQGF